MDSLVGELKAETLTRAFGVATKTLLAETRAVDGSLCARLEETVGNLVRTAETENNRRDVLQCAVQSAEIRCCGTW